MAVKFDASADRLLRTTDLFDYNAPYAWAAWIYISTDRNALSTFLSANDNSTSNQDTLRTTADGTTLQSTVIVGGAATNAAGTNLATGTWYHVALVRESVTSLKVYVNGALDSTSTRDVTGRAVATRIEHGATLSTNSNPYTGRVAAIKVWNTSLTVDEVSQEIYTILPKRLANIYAWYPCFFASGERARDYGGNARDWTEGGTLTDEDPPPVGWGAAATRLIVLSGVAPTVSLIAQDRTIMQRVFGRVFGRVN